PMIAPRRRFPLASNLPTRLPWPPWWPRPLLARHRGAPQVLQWCRGEPLAQWRGSAASPYGHPSVGALASAAMPASAHPLLLPCPRDSTRAIGPSTPPVLPSPSAVGGSVWAWAARPWAWQPSRSWWAPY